MPTSGRSTRNAASATPGGQLWRARRAVAVTGLLLVAALVGAVLAFFGQKKATRAEAGRAERRAIRKGRRISRPRRTRRSSGAWRSRRTTRSPRTRWPATTPATGIAYLGRILRTAPDEHPAAALLWSILRDRNWCLPLLPPLTHKDGVYTVEYSPDGTELLTASKDGTARRGTRGPARLSVNPCATGGDVLKATFSPDGRRVATASNDGTARVWDARTGGPVTPPIRHTQALADVAFSPDGRQVATASRRRDGRGVGRRDGPDGRSGVAREVSRRHDLGLFQP